MINLTFYEFFCGGGMARAGLGSGWTCLLANDFDPVKTRSYIDNWGERGVITRDIAALTTADLPGSDPVDLAHASPSCKGASRWPSPGLGPKRGPSSTCEPCARRADSLERS